MSKSRHVAVSKRLSAGLAVRLASGIATAAVVSSGAQAGGGAPEIRLSTGNHVPACAAPENMTAFLMARNARLDPRFAGIAALYREQGEAWRVRWDYAFFQMIVETNALSFRRGNGEPGDVKPRQNNFAGIGTTGGGVPGDGFPDVRTGVAAHIQHLVAYSGERLAQPVAPRTQLKQDDIVEVSLRLRRPVRFSDLARRWAVDRRYWQSIEAVAAAFRAAHCTTAADLAPIGEQRTTTRGGHAAKGAAAAVAVTQPAVADAPRMVRQPTLAQRPTHAEARSSGPVRTIWRSGQRPASRQASLASPPPAAMPPTAATATTTAGEPSPLSGPAAPQLATGGRPPAGASRQFAFAGGLAMHAGGPTPATVGDTAARTALPDDAAANGVCSIASASYGGRKALLIRSDERGRVRLTALSVLDGFESSMADSYIRAHAPGGRTVGSFASNAEALAHARELCRGAQISEAER